MIIFVFVLLLSLSSATGFTINLIILVICFGGAHGVYPPLVMGNYGLINQGANYSIIFCGYSVAAFFGPKIAVSIAKSNHGDFSKAFYVAISVAVVGLILNFVYQKVKGVAQN